jgi:glycine cleavage system H protein
MSEYLETTIDKFIFRVATDRLYSVHGIWILPLEPRKDGLVRVGLTDYLQQLSGDVAFVHPKPPGTKLATKDIFAEMETIKSTLDLISPIAGEFIDVNAALETTPEIINQDPYGKGWVAAIKAENWEQDSAKLLNPDAYLSLMQKQAEEELNAS